MKKNDIFTAKIKNFGADGEGIVHYDDTTCFVPFSITGEICDIKVLKTQKNIAFCKVENILQKSEKRVDSVCPVFTKCGGCQLQHVNYNTELEIKKDKVINCFKKIAHAEIECGDTVPSKKIYGYRNKLQLPLREENGVKKIGFFRINSHDVIDINDCPLHPDFCKKIIEIIRWWSSVENISFYNEQTKKGDLKHIVVRKLSDSYLITLVATVNKIKGVNRLIDRLLTQFKNFSLLLNINKLDNNIVMSDNFVTLYGGDKICVYSDGISYNMGAYSFMQVNDDQRNILYDLAINKANIDSDTVVIDGYSGAGVLTAMLSKKAKKVYGVEIVAEAVSSAVELAKSNGITNMYPLLGDCAEILPKLLNDSEIIKNKTVLFLDPPRKGVAENVLSSTLLSMPDEIVYISCNPSTLARDIGVLIDTLVVTKNGIVNNLTPKPKYEIISVTPVDMFPRTKHVEVVTHLKKIR